MEIEKLLFPLDASSSSSNLQLTFLPLSQSILLAFITAGEYEEVGNVEKCLKYSSELLSSQKEENHINLTSFSFGLLPNMESLNPLEDLALPLPSPAPITLKIIFSLD